MPSWSDDEGRCRFEVDGVPCYQSPTGCPAHRSEKPKTNTKRRAEITKARRDGDLPLPGDDK